MKVNVLVLGMTFCGGIASSNAGESTNLRKGYAAVENRKLHTFAEWAHRWNRAGTEKAPAVQLHNKPQVHDPLMKDSK